MTAEFRPPLTSKPGSRADASANATPHGDRKSALVSGRSGSLSAGIGVTVHELARSVLTPAFAIDPLGRLLCVNDRLATLLEIDGANAVGQQCTEICLGPDGDLNDCGGCSLLSRLQSDYGTETGAVTLLTGSGRGISTRLTVIACEGGSLVLCGGIEGLSDERAAVRLSCLGTFSVRLPDGALLSSRRLKTLTLLKLLAIERPQPVAEARIVGALWPGAPPARSLRRLRVLVHDLRRTLEPGLTDGRASRFVERQSASYLIPDGAPLEVDIDQFRSAAESARSAAAAGRYEQAERAVAGALQLYRGDLFSADAAASWFASHRRRLKNTWLDTLVLHATLLRQGGRNDEAIEQLQRVVDVDLLREDAHRLLLLLLARSRGRDAALQHFVDMTASFKARVGLPPSRETAVLVNSLRREEDLSDVEFAYV